MFTLFLENWISKAWPYSDVGACDENGDISRLIKRLEKEAWKGAGVVERRLNAMVYHTTAFWFISKNIKELWTPKFPCPPNLALCAWMGHLSTVLSISLPFKTYIRDQREGVLAKDFIYAFSKAKMTCPSTEGQQGNLGLEIIFCFFLRTCVKYQEWSKSNI